MPSDWLIFSVNPVVLSHKATLITCLTPYTPVLYTGLCTVHSLSSNNRKRYISLKQLYLVSFYVLAM